MNYELSRVGVCSAGISPEPAILMLSGLGRVGVDPAETGGERVNSWSAIIPPAWFLQKNDDVHNAVMEPDATFHIMGGNVGKLHDQMTSLSEIYWISGAQHQFWPCGKQ